MLVLSIDPVPAACEITHRHACLLWRRAASLSRLLARSVPIGVPALAQGMMVAEVIMDHLARTCGKSAAELRSLNMYKEGETTHFGQALDGCQVTRVHHTSARL